MTQVVPDAGLIGLRSQVLDGFVHRAVFTRTATTYAANGEPIESATTRGPIRCHLLPLGTEGASLAAASGIKAKWVLKLARTDAAAVGDRVAVAGVTAGVAWGRLVRVEGETGYVNRVCRQVLCSDALLESA